jgi:hypothetical protein
MDLSRLLSSPSPVCPTTTTDVPLTTTFIPYIPEPSVPPLCDPPFASPQITHPALPLSTPQSNSLPAASSSTAIPDFIPSLPSSARPSVPIVNPGFVDTGGATSFAQRHPLKDVQAPRFRNRGSRSDAVKLSNAERKLHKAEKAAQLQEGVDTIIELRNQAIKDLAEKVSVHENVIHKLVNGGTHYVKHRQPGAFNALVHKAAGEMNDGKLPCFSIKSLVLILAYCRPRTRRTCQAQRNPRYRKTGDGQ